MRNLFFTSYALDDGRVLVKIGFSQETPSKEFPPILSAVRQNLITGLRYLLRVGEAFPEEQTAVEMIYGLLARFHKFEDISPYTDDDTGEHWVCLKVK